jgi:hypothetical protein
VSLKAGEFGSYTAHQVQVFASADTPAPAPHDFSAILVPSVGAVYDLNIEVDVSDAPLDSIDFYLAAPDTGITRLVDDDVRRSPRSGTNLTGTIFDHEAEDFLHDGTAPYTGRFVPDEPLYEYEFGRWLNDYYGTDIEGLWALRDWEGTLHSWSISVVTLDESARPTDLGIVDYTEIPDRSPAGATLAYSLTTEHAGYLTLKAIPGGLVDSVTIRLLDETGSELATSMPSDGAQRIDWEVAASENYFLELSGTDASVDLIVANLLHHDGTMVTVHGTAQADLFRFNAENSRDITINGVLYRFDDHEVSAVTFNADKTETDTGSDVVRVEGSAVSETLTSTFEGTGLVPTMVFATEPGAAQPFTVTATNFEQLFAWSRKGEPDTAILEDSPGREKVKIDARRNAEWVVMRDLDHIQKFYRRMKMFEKVDLVGKVNTEKDKVVFNDSPGDNQFTADAQAEVCELTGGTFQDQRAPGAVYRTEGFPDVLARSFYKNDTDEVTFTDSAENDKFRGRRNKAWLYSLVAGSEFDVVVRNFDAAIVEFANGGYDKARFTDTGHDDHFVGHTTKSTFEGNGFHFEVNHAEEVWITSLSDTDNDTAVLNDTALDDLLKGSIDGNGQSLLQFYSPDELGQMLYQLIAIESVDAYGTTGTNKAEVDPANHVMLYGEWET